MSVSIHLYTAVFMWAYLATLASVVLGAICVVLTARLNQNEKKGTQRV